MSPATGGAEPPLIVKKLAHHGVDATLEELDALPLAVELTEEVEAERASQAGQAA